MMTSAVIRKQFLEFFRERGHEILPSAPIVIKNDPTLLFTNAGMNQFKDYFLGNRKSPQPRVADTQKCLRVSGKHNDLEEVGVDTYHHTMFEMLGNWSFGDYFKKEAIAWSWELVTSVYQISRERLYVTVFEGDEQEKLPRDEEAIEEWKKWIEPDRIAMGKKKDNFWEMGDAGPCGPCTEIHVDCRPDEERKKVDGRALVNADHPQVIELWNLVFIQFNRLKDGSLQPLPAKHVDTGLGLERLVRFLQNKQSNYDTDLFTGSIAHIEKITGKPYQYSESKKDIAFRVIADHIRAIAFTIADGQLPSNTGAGYVIRRILRRAVRYSYSYLDYKQPLLFQLIPQLAAQFADVFPELMKQEDFVSKVVREEEEAFLKTLSKGLQELDGFMNPASNRKEEKQADGPLVLSGKLAFELQDTYGFPLDLTQLIARERGWSVDVAGFTQEMQNQKERSRAASAIVAEDWIPLIENSMMEFVGYDSLETRTKVVRYRKVKVKGKESFQLVLQATPFYAESGGQVGDTGSLQFNGEQVDVIDTKKENELIIQFTEKLPKDISGELLARVDQRKRKDIEGHHTATHLLHAALRQILGTHVTQKGSLVNDEHLRFDFSHFAKLTTEEISVIERMVNEKIRDNIPVVISEMSKDEALAMGAMALFGEKYGERVRVVIIDPNYSIELCGGTHVGSTGELGTFKIKHETAVAAGVRRIEAVSGRKAELWIASQFESLGLIKESLRNPANAVKSVEDLINENAELKKKIESLEARQMKAIRDQLLQQATSIQGVQFIGDLVEVSQPDALKKICFDLRGSLSNYLVVLAANIGGKAQVAILIDEKLASSRSLDASEMIKVHVAPLIKGGGGGQKTLATAGGQDVSRLPDVISKIRGLL